MKILIYHGKHGEEFYDISTESRKLGAYLHLFNELGGEGHYDSCEPASEVQEDLFNLAAAGNAAAAMQLIQLRSRLRYEYETVDEFDVHVQETPDFDVWGEDPEHPLRDWQYEIGNDETRLGYWEWVRHKREAE